MRSASKRGRTQTERKRRRSLAGLARSVGQAEHSAYVSHMKPIPKSSQKRFLRLVSAHADMGYSIEAYRALQDPRPDRADYSTFLSMVVCYCRPFTQSRGIGSLLCEYPDYPDWPDPEMNVRHQRMMQIRNDFLGHSSIEGSKVFLLSPGSNHPATGDVMTSYYYAVQKRQFLNPQFSAWLFSLIDALFVRLDDDIRAISREIGSNYVNDTEIYEFETGADAFSWLEPQRTRNQKMTETSPTAQPTSIGPDKSSGKGIFLSFNYPELKDLGKHFLTISSATAVFLLTFIEKLLGPTVAFKPLITACMASLLLSIAAAGIGLFFNYIAGAGASGAIIWGIGKNKFRALTAVTYVLYIVAGSALFAAYVLLAWATMHR